MIHYHWELTPQADWPKLKNKARCLLCSDTIEYKYTHNFVRCKCGSLAVDGGNDYHKRCFQRQEDYVEVLELVYVKKRQSYYYLS